MVDDIPSGLEFREEVRRLYPDEDKMFEAFERYARRVINSNLWERSKEDMIREGKEFVHGLLDSTIDPPMEN